MRKQSLLSAAKRVSVLNCPCSAPQPTLLGVPPAWQPLAAWGRPACTQLQGCSWSGRSLWAARGIPFPLDGAGYFLSLILASPRGCKCQVNASAEIGARLLLQWQQNLIWLQKKKKKKWQILDTFLAYHFLSSLCFKNMNSNTVMHFYFFFPAHCHPEI